MNVTVLRGTLSKPPELRRLPSGDEVANFEVTTRYDGEPADSAPVVLFAPSTGALSFDKGDEVVVTGRVRRRFYRSGGSTQSRTEVVADRIVPAGQRKRVATLLDKAIAVIEAG
jgi:single-strand DNA-binding protein